MKETAGDLIHAPTGKCAGRNTYLATTKGGLVLSWAKEERHPRDRKTPWEPNSQKKTRHWGALAFQRKSVESYCA